MRVVGPTVALALLLGVVASPAQEPPGMQPGTEQTDAKPARNVKRAAKHSPPKITAPVTVPAKTAALSDATVESPGEQTLSAGERLKIQSALLWSGDYTGSVGGEDPFIAAIRNYQKRAKSKVTGVLSPVERTNLLAAAQAHEDEFGWTVVVDPATGVRIGLPLKLVPQARDTPRGTRWSAKHGEVQIETFRIKNPEIRLATLFEQQKTEPSTRKIEQSVLRDDSFVIAGMQGLKKFSVRAYARDGEIRGVTVLFDQMMETIVAPVTAAMVSAFSPFPERSLPFAAPAKSVEYGTGLIVSGNGHIVTDRRLATGCQVIIASGLGDADRIAEDRDSGLALLRVYGPRKLSPLAFPQDATAKGDLTLVGIPDPKEQNGAQGLTEIKARLAENNAIELRQPVPMAGFSGAAALDTQGRFLGMMEMRSFVLASAEPAAPPVRLIPGETIRAFLGAHHVPLASAGTDARSAVVRVICVRK
ncbi:MAG TPA: serine protease [Pseudolabrys sp.]|nr:serine protease [Pseudolabrys sp.]